jgi:hypothetical protein
MQVTHRKRWRRVLVLLLLLCSISGTAVSQNLQPLVVFVEDNTIRSASRSDSGPDGLTRFAEILTLYGARVQFASLADPLPEETNLIVLVRPLVPIPNDQLGHLWQQVERGANVLLALDPVGVGVNTDGTTSGIDRLFLQDYGVGLLNGFLMEPWFNLESVSEPRTSLSLAFPSEMDHPVSQPLSQYDIPAHLWGARPLRVEALGVDSTAFPLFLDTGFAETNRNAFNANAPVPFNADIGADPQGRLLLGAVGENTRTGTRIAVLGDSEILQNDFGLARRADGDPFSPGDQILADRLAGWLLELPEDQWNPLPAGFTYLSVDGSADGWNTALPGTADAPADVPFPAYDITNIRAVRNDSYLYLLIETASEPAQDTQVSLDVDIDQDGVLETRILLTPQAVLVQREGLAQTIPDSAFVVGSAIEARIPLREIGEVNIIPSLCISGSRETAFEQSPDCADTAVTVTALDERDPAPLRFDDTMLIQTRTTGTVNLRGGPGTNFEILTEYRNNEPLAAYGRNEAGTWIAVQTASQRGWITVDLIRPSGDLNALPVLAGAE